MRAVFPSDVHVDDVGDDARHAHIAALARQVQVNEHVCHV
jgi:hypothetical protein